MTAPTTPGVAWKQVVPSDEARRQVLTGTALTVLIVLTRVFLDIPALNGLLGCLAILAFVLGPAPLFSKAANSSERWGQMGLVLGDDGIAVGGSGIWDKETGAWRDPQNLRYSVPWDAVYDVVMVTDTKAAETMGLASWRTVPSGKSHKDVAARPPFFAGVGPLLTFRVDLRRAVLPPLGEDYLISHVWAVPVRDVDAVVREFEARGIPVRNDRSWWGVFVTDPPALDEEIFREWLADPVFLDDPHPRIHREFSGPAPKNLAEYEAACWFEYGDTRRVTDEVSSWAEERWMNANLTSAVLTPEGRAEALRSYRQFCRDQRKKDREARKKRRFF